jgi:hypothetical protein
VSAPGIIDLLAAQAVALERALGFDGSQARVGVAA